MPRSWSSLLGWLALPVLLVVAVASAGLGGSGRPDAPRPARPSASAAPAPVSARAAARVVGRVQLRSGDLPSRFSAVVTRDRTELDAEAAQDAVRLCGSRVPADRLLVAGGRRVFTDPRGQRVRTQVVVYAPGGAEAAVQALRAAPSSCARPVAPGPVELPSALALRVLTGAAPDRTRHQLLALRRGDAVVLLAVDGPPPADPQRDLAVELARVLAARLAG